MAAANGFRPIAEKLPGGYPIGYLDGGQPWQAFEKGNHESHEWECAKTIRAIRDYKNV